MWQVYPQPIRSYVRLSAAIIAASVVLFVVLLILTGIAHVGAWLVHQ
jgi:hypothetical protein